MIVSLHNYIDKFKSSEIETDSRGRIYYFDNLRFWLIMLVVVGHFINPLSNVNEFYKGLYMFIYTFHMPLFIFATGYFAKTVIDKNTGRFKFEKIIHFLIFYLFVTLVIFLVNYYLRQNVTTYRFFQPVNPGWYLMAVIIWYSLIPVIKSIKPNYVIIASIVIALIVGYDPMVDNFLTLSRVICFFPFFMAGYYITQEPIEKMLNFGGVGVHIFAIVFMIAFFIFCVWDPVSYYSMRFIISPHYSYGEIRAFGDMFWLMGPITRFLWYIGASFISVLFMIIVSRRHTFYSRLGQRTLQVFIWHAILVRLFDFFGLNKLVYTIDTWYVVALPIAISIALTFVLAWKPLGAPFDLVLRRKFRFIFKQEDLK